MDKTHGERERERKRLVKEAEAGVGQLKSGKPRAQGERKRKARGPVGPAP